MDPAECGWNGGEDVITVKVTRSATVAAARKVFGGRKAAQASKTGSSGGSTYQAVRDLPGVGDGAFGQNWYATTFTQTHSIVWLRVSNVVVQIDAATFGESKPQAKHQNWALKLMRRGGGHPQEHLAPGHRLMRAAVPPDSRRGDVAAAPPRTR